MRVDDVAGNFWQALEAGKMGATYDGIYWDPPSAERYVRKHPAPPRPKAGGLSRTSTRPT